MSGAHAGSRLVLVTGGARSGKSRVAETRLAELAPGGPWRYVATAEALDDEMRARIAHHRARRGVEWRTVEAPRALADAVRAPDEAGVLVDCITLWLTNLLLAGADDDALLAAADEVAAAARAAARPVVLVTNEVGGGIVPDNALARRFRDVAGWVNQRLASACDEVFLVAAGLPLRLR
ncbi:MAG TPA: bifunctional adenosylcobinamide kinase/adenosylcobinamide-phosphate guanylyltransferase [Polyangia bacterium]|nr:bifunctional adenosylcobinamide kinase/adenosylcobinamide-phosphate guanylyltransferase [Polyangia bacterium]